MTSINESFQILFRLSKTKKEMDIREGDMKSIASEY